MPSLIQKINDRQNIAKWKKEYSVINNFVDKVTADNIMICASYNGYGGCNVHESKVFSDEFLDAFETNIDIVDSCNGRSGNDCDNYSYWSPKDIKYKWSGLAYYTTATRYNSLYGKCSDCGINAYNMGTQAYLLKDGAAIYLGTSHGGPYVVVDVNNAQKGPNQLGRDLFAVKLLATTKAQKAMPLGADGTQYTSEPNGTNGCSKDIGNKSANYLHEASGAGCSAKYLLE